MAARFPRALAVLFALTLLLATGSQAASARSFVPGSICHVFSGESAGFEVLADDAGAWTCSSTGWSSAQPAAWLRFDLRSAGKPDRIVSQISRFERIDVAIVGPAGPGSWRSFSMDDVLPVAAGKRFMVPLGDVSPDAEAVVMRVVRPGNATILSDARLVDGAGDVGWSPGTMLLIAALCGLLVGPLAFNVAFYAVLRERFVIWHFFMVAGMLGYSLVSSGLVLWFLPLGAGSLAILSPVLFALPVAVAGFFAADFIESDKLSRPMRTLLRGAGCWVLGVTLPLACFQLTFYPFANNAYLLAFVPVLAVYLAAMAQAVRRRSRAVLYQAVGWTPVLLVGTERIVRGTGVYGAASDLDRLIYCAIAIEIIATALGVADRFMIIRRQRDRARSEALVMEGQVERDPMTGLFNRRAIEDRFALLRAEGFVTLAVIDLDNFKDINDRFGHAVGDAVIKAVAKALQGDENAIAFRLGGEEFMVLLRGEETVRRAERFRQSVPLHVARIVPELDRLVTASMGVVQVPGDAMPDAEFSSLFDRADKLLYEAKQAGRNRMVNESLRLFVPRRRAERRARKSA